MITSVLPTVCMSGGTQVQLQSSRRTHQTLCCRCHFMMPLPCIVLLCLFMSFFAQPGTWKACVERRFAAAGGRVPLLPAETPAYCAAQLAYARRLQADELGIEPPLIQLLDYCSAALRADAAAAGSGGASAEAAPAPASDSGTCAVAAGRHPNATAAGKPGQAGGAQQQPHLLPAGRLGDEASQQHAQTSSECCRSGCRR